MPTDEVSMPEMPKVYRISGKVKVYVGYQDARIEVGVKLPIIGEKRLAVSASEIDLADAAFAEAKLWKDLPGIERTLRAAAPVEHRISEKVRVYVGYADARIEVGVRIPVLGEKRLLVSAEEIDLAEAAFAEAKRWKALPEGERRLRGAA